MRRHWVGSAMRVTAPVIVVAIGVVLAAGCGGSEQAAPETALLTNAVDKLVGTVPVEKKCEKLFAALSRNLDAKQITTKETLKSRKDEVRSCFATVERQARAAMTPLREILELNSVSELKRGQPKVTAKEVSEMPGAVAAAYVITGVVNGLDEQIGRAIILVDDARLGVPLGAGPLDDITGEEPVQTVNTLLFLGEYRALLAKDLAMARSVLESSAS